VLLIIIFINAGTAIDASCNYFLMLLLLIIIYTNNAFLMLVLMFEQYTLHDSNYYFPTGLNIT